MNDFFKLNDEQRKAVYEELYVKKSMSWYEIAEKLNTYANKVRRDAVKLGIESRDKALAQKNVLEKGRSEHPTKGKKLGDETKAKISRAQSKVWDALTDEGREHRSEIGKDSWNKKTEAEKAEFFSLSVQAMKRAAVEGSKMEKFLFAHLKDTYNIMRHIDYVFGAEQFHLDLYIPELLTAIEIDGPMHYEPIFGDDRLEKRQAADSKKNGLCIHAGLNMVRVRLDKRSSMRYYNSVLEEISKVLIFIKNKKIEKEIFIL
jgi:very-short-patch-repair endonuclease